VIDLAGLIGEMMVSVNAMLNRGSLAATNAQLRSGLAAGGAAAGAGFSRTLGVSTNKGMTAVSGSANQAASRVTGAWTAGGAAAGAGWGRSGRTHFNSGMANIAAAGRGAVNGITATFSNGGRIAGANFGSRLLQTTGGGLARTKMAAMSAGMAIAGGMGRHGSLAGSRFGSGITATGRTGFTNFSRIGTTATMALAGGIGNSGSRAGARFGWGMRTTGAAGMNAFSRSAMAAGYSLAAGMGAPGGRGGALFGGGMVGGARGGMLPLPANVNRTLGGIPVGKTGTSLGGKFGAGMSGVSATSRMVAGGFGSAAIAATRFGGAAGGAGTAARGAATGARSLADNGNRSASALVAAGAGAQKAGGAFAAMKGPLTFLAGMLGIKMVKAVWDVASQLDSAHLAFETFLGSEPAADRFTQKLIKFAKQTPFEFPELVGAAQKIMALGFSADQVFPMLTAIGDATSAIGGGQQTIDRVTLALVQMKSKAKVSGEEIRQLAEAGIPATQYLADGFGKTTQEIQDMQRKGLIPADQAIEIIIRSMEEGSANARGFGGMMKKQSQTMAGLMSTVKDTFLTNSAQIMQSIGFLIRGGLRVVIFFFELFAKVALVLGNSLGNLVHWVTKTKAVLYPLIAIFAVLAINAMAWRIAMYSSHGGIAGFVMAIGWLKASLLNYIRTSKIATTMTLLFNSAWYANPLVWIAIAIIAVVAALVVLYLKVKWFRDGVHAMFHWLGAALKAIWHGIAFAFKNYWDIIILVLSAALGPIGLVIMAFVVLYRRVDWFRNAINAAFRVIGEAFKWLWSMMKQNWDYTALVLSLITGPIGLFIMALVVLYRRVSWFRDGIHRAWKFIVDLSRWIWDHMGRYIKTYGAILLTIFSPIGALIALFVLLKRKGDEWGRFVSSMKHIFAPVGQAFREVGNIFVDTWHDIVNAFRPLGRAFADLGKSIGKALKPFFDVMKMLWDLVVKAWNAIVGAFNHGGKKSGDSVGPGSPARKNTVSFATVLATVFKVLAKVLVFVIQWVIIPLFKLLAWVIRIVVWIIIGLIWVLTFVIRALAWVVANILAPIFKAVFFVLVWVVRISVMAMIWLFNHMGNVFSWVVNNLIMPVGRAMAWFFQNILVPVGRFFADSWSWSWNFVGQVVNWIYRNILIPVWNAIVWYYQNILGPVANWLAGVFSAAWMNMGNAVSWIYHNVLLPIWNGLVWFYQNVLAPVFNWLADVFSNAWRNKGNTLSWIWNNVFQPIWRGLVWFYQNVLAPSFNWLADVFSNAWRSKGAVLSFIWNSVFIPIWNAMVWFYRNVLAPVVNWFKDTWNSAWNVVGNTLTWIYQNVINPTWHAIVDGMHWVQSSLVSALLQIKDFFTSVWNELGNIVHAAWKNIVDFGTNGVNAVINLLNAGFGKVNDVAIKLGVKKDGEKLIPEIPKIAPSGYASGGYVTGPGTATSDSIPARLSHGEYVIKASSVKQIGVSRLNQINALGGGGGRPRLAGDGSGGIAFAGGGMVDAIKALKFVKDQSGKPYVWAAAGPGGYDCSGIVSAAYNVFLGKHPYNHTFSTSNQAGFFQPGMGLFNSGWANPGERGGGSVGHTAGNILGVGFEATPPAVKVGGGVTGINEFAHTGHAGGGGVFDKAMEFLMHGWDWIKEHMLDPIWADIAKKIPPGGITQMMGGAGKKLFDAVVDFIHNQIKDLLDMIGSMGAGPGMPWSGGGDLNTWIKTAMSYAGVPDSWFGPLKARAMQESGGNPNAINNWDSNAAAGHPSQGLFQTIASTFNAFRDPRLPNSMNDPVANAVAAINYMKSRYGSVFNLPSGGYAKGGLVKSYDDGGWLKPGDLATNKGSRPEPVFTNSQWSVLKNQKNDGPLHLIVKIGDKVLEDIVIDKLDEHNSNVINVLDRGRGL